MRLRSLHIARLPGIRPGFTLDGLAPGVNVVVGPNASGKTSLLRALRAVLYRDELRHEGVHVEAAFDDDDNGDTLGALRVGDDLHWTRDGSRTEAPPLPEHRFLSCYTLGVEDLLDDAHETDTEIAERLARELAGGYDLRAVREATPFRLKATHGRTEASELAEADQALRTRMQARQELQRDEARLESLREQKRNTESAGREADLHERALALLESRRQRRALEERLEDFPKGMEWHRGDEVETLAELREQLRRQETDRETAVEKRTSAESALSRSGLADVELDEGALADRQQTLAQLRGAESRLEQKRTELTEREAALAQAVEALGGAPDQPVELEPATIHEVEQALDDKRQLDVTRKRLEDERRHLPDENAPAPDPDRLRTARSELLRWVAAPRTPEWTNVQIAAATALIGSSVAGIAIAGAGVHWGLLALLVPLAWGAYALFLRPDTGDAERRAARQRFAETGETAPADWSPQLVEDRLEALDRAVIEAERQARNIERRVEVDRELSTKDEALEKVSVQLRAVAERVGHDPQILDASLQRWVRLVTDLDRARTATETVRAERDRLTEEVGSTRGELRTYLAGYGEAPEVEQPDADTLSSRLDRLAERLRQREQALRDIDQADRELRRADEQIEATREQIRKLFERVGLDTDDDDSLRQRMDRLEAWKELNQELRDIQGREIDRQQQLGERKDLLALVDGNDEDTLRRRCDALREQEEGLESLIREITRIDDEIERAGHERALEIARARRQQAQDSLSDRLDEALFAEAGRFLLGQVEIEHEQAVQPEALRRAREWFTRFTRYQYELVFSTDDETRFAARETASGEYRRLSELSSGTRMQLLLAVRMAFALSAEHGTTRLPLILDEALTTADPERFRAAAESLTVLARDDGRQVFYLTAQPDDARYWAEHDRSVHCIDLAERRGREHAITEPEVLTPYERPTIPEPAGRSPEEYAVAIGVHAINPWAAPEEVHLFFLLRDDLNLLHRLLALGVDCVGPAESLLQSECVEALLSTRDIQRLRCRVNGVRVWLDAWRRGRGRPVDRNALERSSAVSTRFLDKVTALNEDVNGDGQALIERLAAGDIPRFHTKRREQLEAWLLENGYISDEEALSPTHIRLRVLNAMQRIRNDRRRAHH